MAKDLRVKARLGQSVYGSEVHSVNGKAGHVVLTPEDIGAATAEGAKDFIVHVTRESNASPVFDKTYAEVKEAYESGKIPVAVRNTGKVYRLQKMIDTQCLFAEVLYIGDLPFFEGFILGSSDTTSYFAYYLETEESVDQALRLKADKTEIPKKVSQLQNDAGYLTEHQDISGKADKSEIPVVPTNVSAFTNDAGYLTQHQDISEKADKTAVDALDDRVTALESGSGGGGPTNMANGSADGSVRGINTSSEDESYTMGIYAFAEGLDTKASGGASHAEGATTQASGAASHAEGIGTHAIGNMSHAEGSGATASGDASHAEGSGATASGTASHAEGSGTQATGQGSHAEGFITQASGGTSHAEGNGTKASGIASHAEGLNTKATGDYSHAEGDRTQASGIMSHAEGSGTIAQGHCQHTSGSYNIAQGSGDQHEDSDYVVIIGNGSDGARSNAFAMKWDGTFVFANGTEITPAQFASLLALLNSVNDEVTE